MEYLLNTFNELNGIVWGAPMLVMILGTGLFLMFLLRFMPLRKIGAGLRCCGKDAPKVTTKAVRSARFRR